MRVSERHEKLGRDLEQIGGTLVAIAMTEQWRKLTQYEKNVLRYNLAKLRRLLK